MPERRCVLSPGVEEKGALTTVGLGRVEARGQVTIQERSGRHWESCSVTCCVEVTNPGVGQFRVLGTTRPLDEFFGTYRVDGPVPADVWGIVAGYVARDTAPPDA